MEERAQTPVISTVDFLRRVWPVAGHFAIFSGGKHAWVDGPEAAAEAAERADSFNKDVYFSTAAFSKADRKARFAVSHKILVTDFDVGDKPNEYESQRVALLKPRQWCKDHSFHEPTFIISSGNGIYFIWVLTEAVPTDRWKAVAEKFKRAMAATGLKHDPTVTADASRIIRVPGTRNWKDPAGPKQCVVLSDSGKTVSLEDFDRAIPLTGPRDTSAPLAPRPAPAGKQQGGSIYTAGMEADYPPAHVELIVRKCGQMAQALQDQGQTTEPIWRARLSVLWRCQDGETLIHAFSKGDPRYNAAQTSAKAEATAGPATCEHFKSLNPDACKGCPFSGKITSPIVLGTDLPEPETLPEDEPGELRLNQTGNFRVTGVGVRHVAKDEETGQEDLRVVSRVPIWVVEVRERARDVDEEDASSLLLRWHTADGKSKTAVAMQAEIHEGKSLVKWLSNHNLISEVENTKLFAAFIREQTYEHNRLGRTTAYYDRLGWFGEDQFVMAGHMVTADKITPVRVQSTTPIGVLVPSKNGNARAWGEAVAKLADYPPAHWHLFVILAGLASPLLRLAGWQCAVLSLAGSTGTGKSTAMAAALSWYGDPRRMMMTSTATANAINLQTAAHQHIPTGTDEISRWPSWRQCDFVYDSTNGEGKASLTQQRAMRRAPRWSLLSMVTTNNPIYDQPQGDVDEPIRRRVLELQFSKMETLPTEMAEELHAAMEAHYGHGGLAFMQHVLRNKAQVKEMLATADRALKEHSGLQDSDRFQRWLIAATIVAATAACAAGIFPATFDPLPILYRVAEYAAVVSKQQIAEEIRIKDAVAEFLVQHKSQVVYWATVPADAPRNQAAAYVDVDVFEPVARYDFRTDMLYVQASVLRKYLREEHRLSMNNVKDWRKAVGIEEKVFKLAKRLPVVNCFVFPASRVGLVMDEVITEEVEE